MTIILEEAEHMKKVSKIGDENKCFIPEKADETTLTYCQENFPITQQNLRTVNNLLLMLHVLRK